MCKYRLWSVKICLILKICLTLPVLSQGERGQGGPIGPKGDKGDKVKNKLEAAFIMFEIFIC